MRRRFVANLTAGRPFATFTFAAASVTFSLSQRTVPHTTKAIWSDGNGDVFGAVAGAAATVTRSFGSAAAKDAQLYTADPTRINSIVFPQGLTGLALGGAAPTPGTLDFSGIPNADSIQARFASAQTFKGFCNGTVELQGASCLNQPINFAGLQCAELRFQETGCTGIAWPTVPTLYSALIFSGHKLTGTTVFPAFPAANYIIAQGNFNAVPGWIPDLTASPGFNYFDLSKTNAQGVVLASTTLMANLIADYNRFGSTIFGGGTVATLAASLTAAVRLTLVSLVDCCLTEANISDIIYALWQNRASRVAGTKNVYIGGDGTAFYYPNNNGSYGANAPVVLATDRARIADLAAGGMTVSYNKQIVMTASYLGGSAVRVTYGGAADIDIWAVGDTVTLTTTNGVLVAAGAYTVSARQSGKVWDLTFGSAVPLASGQTVVVTVDK
jgi:hypothetical protein